MKQNKLTHEEENDLRLGFGMSLLQARSQGMKKLGQMTALAYTAREAIYLMPNKRREIANLLEVFMIEQKLIIDVTTELN